MHSSGGIGPFNYQNLLVQNSTNSDSPIIHTYPAVYFCSLILQSLEVQSLTSPASSVSQLGYWSIDRTTSHRTSCFPQWFTNLLHIGTKEMQMLAYLGDVIRGCLHAMCLGRGMKC